MNTIEKISLYSEVTRKVGKESKAEMISWMNDRDVNYWGMIKGEDIQKVHVNLTLYKDLFNLGFLSLWSKIKHWYGNSHKSLAHNIKLTRKNLKIWARNSMVRGDLQTWNNISDQVKKIQKLKKVCLWMDSSDFSLIGKSQKLTKDLYWSFKNKSIGRRFQFIFDAEGRCRALWGGYSPKIIDSQWVELYKNELTDKFNGAHIIADGHYYASRLKSQGVTFVTPIPETVKIVPNDLQQYLGITQKDRDMNLKIRNLRARVENPFGQVKGKFKALSNTFQEDAEQLECLVFIAFAIHNKSI